jgi:hypothetical protein
MTEKISDRDRQAVDDLLRIVSLNARTPTQMRLLLLAAAAEVERRQTQAADHDRGC